MMTLRRHTERRHVQHGTHDIWYTFHPEDHHGRLADGFGNLVFLNEVRLRPGGSSREHEREERELVTYVYKGALAQGDSTGYSGVLSAGEFECLSTGRGVRRKATNASRADWAHVFRIALRPWEVGLDCVREQRRFTAGQRRNALCVIASGDGRRGSLRIHQDVLVYSCILDPGFHLVHEVLPGRSSWVHVVSGMATVDDSVLAQGDGMGVSSQPSVSLRVEENTEILLVDLGQARRSSAGCGSVP